MLSLVKYHYCHQVFKNRVLFYHYLTLPNISRDQSPWGLHRTEAVHVHNYVTKSEKQATYQCNSGGFDVNRPGRCAANVCHQQEWFLRMHSLQCFKLDKKQMTENDIPFSTSSCIRLKKSTAAFTSNWILASCQPHRVTSA